MSKQFLNNPRIVRSIQPKNKQVPINQYKKRIFSLFFFIFSDNPVPYRVPLQSNLFYSNAYYTCIGNETVLNDCRRGNFRLGCSNQGGEQVGISCESKYCIKPFKLLYDK